MPASGDEQPVSHGGMACRHGQDRGGKDCGYCLFAWTTQTRCPHTHSRRKSSSRKLLDLKDKGRRDYTLTSAIPGPSSGVHFNHEERVHKGTKIALDDASKANWHMHALLYGLINLLMDDVLGQPAEDQQQVRINVLDAPPPEKVGIPALIDIG